MQVNREEFKDSHRGDSKSGGSHDAHAEQGPDYSFNHLRGPRFGHAASWLALAGMGLAAATLTASRDAQRFVLRSLGCYPTPSQIFWDSREAGDDTKPSLINSPADEKRLADERALIEKWNQTNPPGTIAWFALGYVGNELRTLALLPANKLFTDKTDFEKSIVTYEIGREARNAYWISPTEIAFVSTCSEMTSQIGPIGKHSRTFDQEPYVSDAIWVINTKDGSMRKIFDPYDKSDKIRTLFGDVLALDRASDLSNNELFKNPNPDYAKIQHNRVPIQAVWLDPDDHLVHFRLYSHDDNNVQEYALKSDGTELRKISNPKTYLAIRKLVQVQEHGPNETMPLFRAGSHLGIHEEGTYTYAPSAILCVDHDSAIWRNTEPTEQK